MSTGKQDSSCDGMNIAGEEHMSLTQGCGILMQKPFLVKCESKSPICKRTKFE